MKDESLMTNFENLPPEDEQLAVLLSSIQPQPGVTLGVRVASVTWNTSSPLRHVWHARLSRRAVFFALALMGVLIIFFTIPPFNGVAQRFANFFNRADDNIIPIALTAQPPSEQFPLTIAEAAAQAGFPVLQPGWLPEGFQLNGAAYDPALETVALDYHSPVPGRFLRLTQSRIAENRLNVSNIGVNAEVQTLEILTASGEIVPGEYVAGAWQVPSMLDHLKTGQPDMTATMQANWNPNAKVHMLRWEIGGYLYEIIHADQTLDALSAEMLVKIAESMK